MVNTTINTKQSSRTNHSRRKRELPRGWSWCVQVVLFSVSCLITQQLKGSDPSSIDANVGVYNESYSPSGFKPGDRLNFRVVLRPAYSNRHCTVLMRMTRAGFAADTVLVIQLPPSKGSIRRSSVNIPTSVIDVSVNCVLDWESDPDLQAYWSPVSPDSGGKNELWVCNRLLQVDDEDTLRQFLQGNPLVAATALLQLLLIESKSNEVCPESKVIELTNLSRSILPDEVAALFHYTVSLAGERPQFDSLLSILTSTTAGKAALENSQFTSALFQMLSARRLKEHKIEVCLFVGKLIGTYPSCTFSNWFAYKFRGLITGAAFAQSLELLINNHDPFQAKLCLASFVDANADLGTLSVLSKAADFLEGATDSLVAMRRRNPGPLNDIEHSSWQQRQITAFYETRLLNKTRADNSYLHPAMVIMPSFSRSDIRLSSLAKVIAGSMEEAGDSIHSNPYLALVYRYTPLDAKVQRTLNRRFPPFPSTEVLDSLVGILDAMGLLSTSHDQEIPPSILNQRPQKDLPSVIVFVSSTCSACGTELAALKELAQNGYEHNILIVLVGQWHGKQKEKYQRDQEVVCVADPPAEFVDNLRITAVPTTLVLNPRGSILMRFDGMPPREQLKQAIEASGNR